MDAVNPLDFYVGMPPAPVAMHNTINNPLPNFDIKTIQSTPGLSFSPLPPPALLPGPLVAAPPARQGRRIPCNFPLCNKTFKRASDRKRHGDSVHLNVPGLYLCHIPGCPNSHGKGYKRADKSLSISGRSMPILVTPGLEWCASATEPKGCEQ
ncbi:hypothetical protein ACEPPN_002920 [Leptodophora sp. 'Broadleaf-Isolate-01']